VQYPGRSRIDGIRTRLSDIRRDADLALEHGDALRADLEALRREVAALTTAMGSQIAALGEAVERLEQAVTDRIDPGADADGSDAAR
jgi:polyhydroxyalkanoate synthesis regulator phasin